MPDIKLCQSVDTESDSYRQKACKTVVFVMAELRKRKLRTVISAGTGSVSFHRC